MGVQGGDLETVIKNGKDSQGAGMLINVGRDIMFNSNGNDFAEKAAERAGYYYKEMSQNFK